MSRILTPRFPTISHAKQAFEEPFSYFKEYNGVFSDAVKPLISQSSDEIKELAGSFPDNIAHWIWSVPGQHDGEDWFLFCILDTGAYALYYAGCCYTGFSAMGHMVLYVSNKADDIINLAMTDKIYELYIQKTLPYETIPIDIDPQPHGPPEPKPVPHVQGILEHIEDEDKIDERWICYACNQRQNSIPPGDHKCIHCGTSRANKAGSEYILNKMKLYKYPPTTWGKYEAYKDARWRVSLLKKQWEQYPAPPELYQLLQIEQARVAEYLAH